METILAVNKHDLDRLSAEEAVDVLRELLWAEATSLAIAKNLINVPTAITVKDGGIDAEVKDVEIQGGQGIIKKGLTRYQIKTGDFSLGGDSKVKEILFKTNTTELKTRIKSCLDKKGTLIVVLFGWDNPQIEDNQLIVRFRAILENIDQKYKTAKIEVWQQNNIIGFLKPYPSLALRVNGRSDLLFRTHNSWSRDAEMRRVFKAGEEQENLISNIQNELRKNTEAVHIRVLGEPGIGKTRLVLEATRAIDLHPQVAYCSSANLFRDSGLMNEIYREDNQFHVILVVDECDQTNSAYLWNIFKYLGSRIKLISIYSEYERTSGNILALNVPPLNKEKISSIIQEYGIAENQAERWSELCDGSPRVAQVIGWNLTQNPDDLLRSPDTVDVWERYIVGYDNSGDPRVDQRREVLQHLALFKRFGYSRPVVSEAQAVAKLIEGANPQITWSRFQQIVSKLRERRILQGDYTLHITPKALHIKLWIDWWQIHGSSFVLENIKKDLSPKLLDWFYEMFKYSTESEVASRIVQKLLGPEGAFSDYKYLQSNLRARFFLALTEADPRSAVNCLKRTIGTWSKAELIEFTTGRREVVWALEKIAVWRDLFSDAARLLLKLGEAENETYSTNASGVFAQLFSPAYGEVAPTEASPQERFPILKEALTSESREIRRLALKACDHGLESEHFVRFIGLDQQSLGVRPNGWMPKTDGELFDAYSQVWHLLTENLDDLVEDEQQEAFDIMLRKLHGLAMIGNLRACLKSPFTVQQVADELLNDEPSSEP